MKFVPVSRANKKPEHAAARLASEEPAAREAMTELLALIEDRRRLDLLAEAVASEGDALLRLRQVAILAEEGDRRGLLAALETLRDGTPPLLRDEAHALLLRVSGEDFGYDPFSSESDNRAALQGWRSWLE